jgi:hypothetical protein
MGDKAKIDHCAADNEAKALFMAKHHLTHATWNECGDLTSATRAIVESAPAREPRTAEELHAALIEQRKRLEAQKHETMFAHTSIRPKLIASEPDPSVVPRAVRARADARGRHQTKQ